MESCENMVGQDAEILQKLMSALSDELKGQILGATGDDPQIKALLFPGSTSRGSEAPPRIGIDTLKEKWKRGNDGGGSRFEALMEKYIRAYLQGKLDTDYEPSRSYLENLVSNHSKWNRMMHQKGQGRQYRDDIRRLCFIFHLGFPEANEFMMSAGQPFDFSDLRDYIIVDFLTRKDFSKEGIDAMLRDAGLPELFPAN